MAKATEYAQKTLAVLDAAPKPDAAGLKVMQAIRHECYHLIAINYYEEQKYEEALDYFDRALKIKKFQDGFYYMAQCYWRLGEKKQTTTLLEKAHDYFAAAEIMGGNLTEKAKEYKEELYKSQHNGNLTGIRKVNKRGQEILDSYSQFASAQKDTELAQDLNK